MQWSSRTDDVITPLADVNDATTANSVASSVTVSSDASGDVRIITCVTLFVDSMRPRDVTDVATNTPEYNYTYNWINKQRQCIVIMHILCTRKIAVEAIVYEVLLHTFLRTIARADKDYIHHLANCTVPMH